MCLNDMDKWQGIIHTHTHTHTRINVWEGNFLDSQVKTDSAPWGDSTVQVIAHSYLTIYGRYKDSSNPKANKHHAVEILGQD
jgi:hypothetical protein